MFSFRENISALNYFFVNTTIEISDSDFDLSHVTYYVQNDKLSEINANYKKFKMKQIIWWNYRMSNIAPFVV